MREITHEDTLRIKRGFYKGVTGKPMACIQSFPFFPKEYLMGRCGWVFSWDLEIVEKGAK